MSPLVLTREEWSRGLRVAALGDTDLVTYAREALRADRRVPALPSLVSPAKATRVRGLRRPVAPRRMP